MTDREKLAELLEQNMFIIPAWQCTYMEAAAELIANGVTFAKDTNVPSTWEPISDPPPTGEVLAYSKESGYMAVGWIEPCLNKNDEIEFICENGLEPLVGVTHWMPPPEPPKEV